MPYKKKKNKGNKKTTSQAPVVQWYNKKTDQYEKIDRATGLVISKKVTPGPYKNFEIVSRRPRTRKVNESPKQPTSFTRSAARKSAKNVKKTTPKPESTSSTKKTTGKTNYLNNKDLLAEVIASKEKGQMTDKLARMLMMLCARYGKRGNFSGYTYNEDMQAYAMLMLVRTWNSFDPAKSNNPFAFFTQCVKNSFIQYLNGEKRHRTIRDEIMVEHGLNPSYTYQLEHEPRGDEDQATNLHEEKQTVFEESSTTQDDDSLDYV